MKSGKLTNKELEELIFSKINIKNKEVLAGPGIGADTAALDFCGDEFIVSSDPITGSKKGIGKLCINISCNDIATAMARPIAMLVTILIPVSASLEDVNEIVDEMLETCDKNGVDLIGGHTEVTDSVNQFVLSGTCIGRKKKRINNPVEVGDKIVMSKYAGLEGSAIIALDLEEKIKDILTAEEIKKLQNLINDTIVIKEGLIAGTMYENIKGLHDATEGGVYGAIWELVEGSGYGAEIYKDKINIMPETLKLAKYLEINPYKLISSGVMLFITNDASKLIKELEKEEIKAVTIGEIKKSKGAILVTSQEKKILDPPGKDELYKVI